ncbi:hypothetical protein FA13DRAFT_1797572 [Coprinellus micaceus]|uniref:Uncharacterized protein n=1 Tax=Coprinellus micaceus TaxID=71717 RepID=A0A4Y7SQ94_COPMI|nr:hypothetical protein FA13DRAFT_1797572 [Coprinellus micaceus]
MLVGTTALTSIQIENIRALTNTMAFGEERYEFTRMTEDVMDAFKTPTGIKILRAKVSELVSSITGQLRELVLESLGRKHKFWSLFLFTHKACKKFCGKSTEPTRGMLFKCVIIRRFVEDHPVVMPTDMSTHLAKKRKANNSGGENGDVAKATTTPYMVTMNRDEGMMKSHTNETVPFPPIPPKANFWAMFEWHFAILRLALGQTNSEAWKKYLMDIIEEDRSNYPHSSSSGVDDIDALLNAPAPEPAVQWTLDTMVNFEGRDLYTPGTVPQ